MREYYDETENRLSYEHFINRACFWMATGSGKTLVIVKLIEILAALIQRGEIPPNDILVLTHRDDLIDQLQRHVDEFNRARSDFRIILRTLKEYESTKHARSLFSPQEVTVFYYRSDNLGDAQKDKIIDFRNYENDGRWYLLLDEAHKGDREDSKRQHIYSILSRNGFLFNFSATFTDTRDIATTVYNFNLAEYIQRGYGKHIALLQQEMRAFKKGEDFTGEEKRKIVLKALLLLTYIRQMRDALPRPDMYHSPMMLVLVNSVNTDDADLKLFFEQLESIAHGAVSERDALWRSAIRELRHELESQPIFVFEAEKPCIDANRLRQLTLSDVLSQVFHAQSAGEIEVLVRPSDRKELAFKLKTADRPFALIKIGDIAAWLRENLAGYTINERFEDESYFAQLNADDSAINLLMGSRAFYEGWDSNRPNVITYINIGTQQDARKFLLQSLGRGVRIEPLKGQRQRLEFLYQAGQVAHELFAQAAPYAQALETLFVFATNRNAVQEVMGGLAQERAQSVRRLPCPPEVNPQAKQRCLLVPVYKRGDRPLAATRTLSRFPIHSDERALLQSLVASTDARVLLLLTDSAPHSVALLQSSVDKPEKFFRTDGQRIGNPVALLRRAAHYFSIVPEEVDRLKPLNEEINHYRHITVSLEHVETLCEQIEAQQQLLESDPIQTLKERFQRGEIDIDTYTDAVQRIGEKRAAYTASQHGIEVKSIAQHYYLPLLMADESRAEYIQHVIKTPSEREFIERLEAYLQKSNHLFAEFDGWMFSKLDEHLDRVYIPYYDALTNRIAQFKPDFIFWLQKGARYFIVFIDPKGTEYRDADRKLEGYRRVFETDAGVPRPFAYNGLTVEVYCYFWARDTAFIPETDYKRYWVSAFEEWLRPLCSRG
ncbi:MAG: DEAD/DEAH box helicase family protein [Fimbriimonadales bacterium]